MWKESYFLNSRKKQELMDDFFLILFATLPVEESFSIPTT